MVRNNIEIDAKMKLLEAGKTQQQVGAEIGTTGQYVNRVLKRKDSVINDTYVKIMENLGFDIEMVYIPRTLKP